MDEPIHLDSLPEVARGVGGDPVADGSDLQELRLAAGALLRGGHFARQLRVALRKHYGRVAGNGHGLKLLLLVCGLGIVDIIQLPDALCDARFHIKQALAVHPAIHGSVSRCALLHKLSENSGVIRLFPLL